MTNPTTNDEPKKAVEAIEGEGSYTATRRYNQHLAEAIDSGNVAAAADAARQAMEGAEREELERAAAQGKAGPKEGKQDSQKAPRNGE